MLTIRKMVPRWVRKSVRESAVQYRRLAWKKRALPQFIVIGAQKSGTTSLYSWLARHPSIARSFIKEVHFFDGGLDPAVDNYKKGEAWYRAQFPLITDVGNKLPFEASPLYLFNPLCPDRIFDLLPKVKLIAVLRNPTERAISHYFHEKRIDPGTRPLYDSLLAEEDWIKEIHDHQDYKSRKFIHNSYLSRGLYADQLKRYFSVFDRSQVLVLKSESLFSCPAHALSIIFKFLGVDGGFRVNDLEPKNVGSNRGKVEERVYDYLNEYYAEPNRALYDLLGEDYGW